MGWVRGGKEGQVFLGLQNDREWVVLCEQVLGRPELVADPRFATNPDRVIHDAELRVTRSKARSPR